MNLKYSQIAVAFLVGLTIGTALGPSPVRRKLRGLWDKRTPHERMLGKLSSRLNLTADQKVQVEKIFDSKKEKLAQIRSEIHEEIRKILNPDQMGKYNELEAKMGHR